MPQLNWRNLRVIGPVALFQSAAYGALNHWPLFPPRALPLTALDRAVPFWPWTVWPYLLLLTLGPLTALLIRSAAAFRATLCAYGLAVPATFLTFLLVPTTYPRPPAPVAGGLTCAVYRLLVVLDPPGCCCPSGHVVVPLVVAGGVWRDGHPWRKGLLGLVLLLTPSVLTTKQHYAWDVLAAVVAALSGLAAARLIRLEKPS